MNCIQVRRPEIVTLEFILFLFPSSPGRKYHNSNSIPDHTHNNRCASNRCRRSMSSSSLPTVPRGRGSGGNLVTPDSRSGVLRASPSPSGTRSAPASVANRQPGRNTPLKTARLSRSQQGREQRGESESNDDISLQEVPPGYGHIG